MGNSPPSTAPTFLKYTLLYIAEKPVNRGIAAFFGVEEGGEHPGKGVQEGYRRGREWEEGGTRSRCTAAAYRTGAAEASRGLNQADEADDGAEGADVVLGEGGWFVTLVFGDTEDAVVVIFALLDILDENTLACVDYIDPTPLEEMYLGNFPAGDDFAIAVERSHGVAGDTNKEVGALGFELRDGVVLTVFEAHAVVVDGREARYGLHGDERYTFVL